MVHSFASRLCTRADRVTDDTTVADGADGPLKGVEKASARLRRVRSGRVGRRGCGSVGFDIGVSQLYLPNACWEMRTRRWVRHCAVSVTTATAGVGSNTRTQWLYTAHLAQSNHGERRRRRLGLVAGALFADQVRGLHQMERRGPGRRPRHERARRDTSGCDTLHAPRCRHAMSRTGLPLALHQESFQKTLQYHAPFQLYQGPGRCTRNHPRDSRRSQSRTKRSFAHLQAATSVSPALAATNDTATDTVAYGSHAATPIAVPFFTCILHCS